MADEEYTIGKCYFLKDGRECELLALAKTDADHQAKYVVAPLIIVQDHHGDESLENGPVEFAHELFKKAPVAKRSEEVAEAERKLKEVQGKLEAIRRETLAAAAEKTKIEAALGQFEGVKHLVAFMEGKCAFIVQMTENAALKIPYAAWIKNEAHYGKFPIITLFAGSGYSNPAWKTTVRDRGEAGMWPCMTEAEADQIITNLVADKMNKAKASGSAWSVDQAINFATNSFRDIPNGVKRWKLEQQIALERSSIASKEAEIAKSNAAIEARTKAIVDLEERTAALEALNAPGQEGA